jgi:CheY-like chemotaxis protein
LRRAPFIGRFGSRRQRLASGERRPTIPAMNEPLALICYERLLPGSQLVNRLQDAGYRVQTVNDASALAATAEQAGALVAFVDLVSRQTDVAKVIEKLRQQPITQHLPIIAFCGEREAQLQTTGRNAGASLVVSDTALLMHLQPLLDQALALE